MIKRLLIANRGEIAVRIIRACREMGISPVAVYSTADRESLAVRMADEAVCVGPPASAKSYLVASNLIMAALRAHADAIHPGVGFLSESADFARQVEGAGLLFIGPRPETIELLGDKVAARETAEKFGLPITPGTKAAVSTAKEAEEAVRALGFPVIIKAAAGGGGKGMRIVREKAVLAENLEIARTEAQASFGDERVFIERYVENPRHVELQMLSDGAGNVAVLGERDCTVQRNHQKLIEESPSPIITPDAREKMTNGALKLFAGLKYRGAGTIEFLVERDGDHGLHPYFMEVNARVQVEHPVSELITGVDIIREQIRVSSEGRMETAPGVAPVRGWAVECRINARAPGRITRLEVPGGPGVRFDSFLYAGYAVVPFYDALVGKLIVHDADRARALCRMNRALSELVIEGVPTNQAEQAWIVNEKTFKAGEYGTSYYEDVVEGAKSEEK
jgi:acetyl-CoA carboxylase biotin carboxylase subunit